jgi:hypothetical protein
MSPLPEFRAIFSEFQTAEQEKRKMNEALFKLILFVSVSVGMAIAKR